MSFNQDGVDKIKEEAATQKALEWWNKIPTTQQAKYAREIYHNRYAPSLSSSQIRRMYEAFTKPGSNTK